jgi:hypothetical protein
MSKKKTSKKIAKKSLRLMTPAVLSKTLVSCIVNLEIAEETDDLELAWENLDVARLILRYFHLKLARWKTKSLA